MKGHNYAHLKSGAFSLDMSKIAARYIIAPLSDIPMFYIKYLTMHAGAIRQLLYGCVCTGDNPLAKSSWIIPLTYAQTIQ